MYINKEKIISIFNKMENNIETNTAQIRKTSENNQTESTDINLSFKITILNWFQNLNAYGI